MSSIKDMSHRLSRLPVRDRTSESKLPQPRGKSFDRTITANEKRSIGNFSRSRSCIAEPGIVRQRSGSIVRQALATPLKQVCRFSKSPLISTGQKDFRPVTDKKWQYEQLVKVRNFMDEELPQLDYNSVKSGMSLEMFVVLINSLFQLIDKRIKITKENYVEEVPVWLKTLRYVVNIKSSLMKTVNTPHSWSQVISIFSWLVDLITELNAPEKQEENLANLVDKTMCKMYKQWSKNSNVEEDVDLVEEFKAKLEEASGVNDDKINNLNKEISHLGKEINKYEQQNAEIRTKCENAEAYIADNKAKCEKFLADRQELETNFRVHQDELNKNMTKIGGELAELSKTKQELKAKVEAQPYSLDDLKQIEKEINSLKLTIKLKQEQHQEQRQQLDSSDFQLTDLTQQLEAKACRYNKIINQTKLLDPKYEELHIRENSFVRNDTLSELQNTEKLLITAVAETREIDKTIQSRIAEFVPRVKQGEEEVARNDKELQELKKHEAEMRFTLEHKLRKMALEKEKKEAELMEVTDRLEGLRKSRIDVRPLQEKLEQLKVEIAESTLSKQKQEYNGLEFVVKLDQQITNMLGSYMTTIDNVTEEVHKGLTKLDGAMASGQEQMQKAREEAENPDNVQ